MGRIEGDMEILREYDYEGMHVTAKRKIMSKEEHEQNLKRVCDGIVWLVNREKELSEKLKQA